MKTFDSTRNKKNAPLTFDKYKKRVESVRYKDFSISLSDIAKYPGQMMIEYKYQISCPNWEGSGMPGVTIICPAHPPLKAGMFTGLTFDSRVQFTKKELQEWLKEIADKVRYAR